MTEQLISLETAKLAKEKGFLGKSQCWYTDKWTTDPVHGLCESNGYYENSYAATTQSLLQKWLRDVHKLHIEILLEEDSPYTKVYHRVMKRGQYFAVYSHSGMYCDTYEESLEQALLESLKLL